VLVRQLAAGGVAVLMVTHDLFRAKDVGTRVGIMKNGRLLTNLSAAALSHAQLESIYLGHMQEPARAGAA
jgi:ABC-2 type transport system ATP-binding protein